jgi:hypothetical protein
MVNPIVSTTLASTGLVIGSFGCWVLGKSMFHGLKEQEYWQRRSAYEGIAGFALISIGMGLTCNESIAGWYYNKPATEDVSSYFCGPAPTFLLQPNRPPAPCRQPI